MSTSDRLPILKRFLVKLLFCFTQPARRFQPVRPIRSALRVPVLFDLGSLFLQAKDVWRVREIRKSYALNDAFHKDVQDHNAGLTQSKIFTTTRRPERIYDILTLPNRSMDDERLLIIGPRNALELFIAWTRGFRWANIRGIDLYAVNPQIEVMDMENMTFDADTFDAVSSSSTISYAKDTNRVFSEIWRVLKPGGRLAFNVTHDPGDERWTESQKSGKEIHALLKQTGFTIYHHDTISRINSLGRGQTVHLFGCKKPDPNEVRADDFTL